MNIADRKTQKAEAIKRLKMLGVMPYVVDEFEKNGILNYSYSVLGFLYQLSRGVQELVNKFEEGSGYLVYHVIEEELVSGREICLLYIGKNEDDWLLAGDDIKREVVRAYVINEDDETRSEFKYIGIKKGRGGGLVRVA
jgi:hypothetical protein